MKAVRYYGIQDIRVEEIEKPRLQGDEVLVKVLYAGVCGSDMHIYRRGMFMVNIPETMGHELVGVIEQVGSDAQEFRVGDYVVADPRVPCGQCSSCLKGSYHTCAALGFIGEVSPGGFAEYLAVKKEKLIKLKSSEDVRQAVLTEPLAVAWHICEKGRFSAEDHIAVVGAGPIGLLTVLLAREICKVKDITAIDVSEKRLEMASRAGANSIMTGFDHRMGLEYDKVVEAAGNEATLNGSLNLVAAGGTLLVVGLFENTVSFDPNVIVCKEIKVTGCNGYTREDLEKAADLITGRDIEANFLITHEFPLDAGQKVFALLNSSDKSAAKVVFKP
ncbi:hypothetical protein DCMF_09410 [Candidatus Formimonas warabiya]|uniref:Enoyl reductase (ER) domain-containing protein n=2 Tax=Formimonas warabiya TaxID=1761012 RepID=A0A3G1L1Z7_FORW1|nr:hypothetical protein DCMF_09410 [Candidatus Formimonas warabiya]